jgi:hypothetical protein
MRRLGVLAVVLAALAACGGEERQPAGDDASATSSPGEGVVLEGETLDGAPLSLADLRGKPVFVNVWASW